MTRNATLETSMVDVADITEKDIFAATEQQGKPEPQSEQQTTPAEGQASQGQPEGREPAQEGEGQPQREVPSWVPAELKTERRRRKEAEKAAQTREREMAELRGRMQVFEQLLQGQQTRPNPQEHQQPQQAPDLYTDAPAAIRHEVRPLIDDSLKPLTQGQQQMAAAIQYNNRLLAEQVFTAEAVKQAEEAFMSAMNARQLSQPEYDRVANSPNRFAEAVRWHKEIQTRQTVGDDPQKWFEDQLDERMLSPEFQQKLVERMQARAQEARASGQSPPVFNIPPSLNKAPGTSGSGSSSPISEADIFAAAPTRMGRRL